MIEIKNKIVKYLNNKGINIFLDENEFLSWNYTAGYSKFKIYLLSEDENDDKSFTIKYHTNQYIKGIKRLRTLTRGSFCSKIYKNLIKIKENLDKIGLEEKNKTDLKNKYCTELEIHYKQIHKYVHVYATKNFDDSILINIECSDSYNKSTHYSITYINNKYYLTSKLMQFEETIDI